MKRASLETFPRGVRDLLGTAGREKILITRKGKPFAMILGLEGKDKEDAELEASREFWELIEERRKDQGSKLKDVVARVRKKK